MKKTAVMLLVVLAALMVASVASAERGGIVTTGVQFSGKIMR